MYHPRTVGENPRNQPGVVVLKRWRQDPEFIAILGFMESLRPGLGTRGVVLNSKDTPKI